MTARDVRPHIVADALAHPTLAHARRIFLITVTMLPAEYDEDGHRRPGSRGMDASGRFAFHYDYLAKWLHTSPGNAKRTAERLAEDETPFLRKVHPGTFGRPATWQAMRVRGDWSRRITPSTTVTPYGLYEAYVRSDQQSPLPYRTPADVSHAPAVGDSPRPVAQVIGSNEGIEDPELRARRAVPAELVCEFHPWQRCPSDCRNHQAEREESA